MRYKFEIEDKKTVTNETVKVFVQVSGPDTASREQLEVRVKKALSEFIPSASWAFAGFTQSRIQGYPMFTVQATTRIGVELNDNLEDRAKELELSEVSVHVTTIDQKVPAYLLRDGYEAIRANLLELARAEVASLKAAGVSDVRIKSIEYNDSAASASGKFSTANSYQGAGAGSSIGYSEKISITATITLTDGRDEPATVVSYDH